MKRILPLLLTLCLLLGCFAACGSQAPSGTPAESAASASAAEDKRLRRPRHRTTVPPLRMPLSWRSRRRSRSL